MSVKGDKTRMDQLSRSDECYVRASPTRGVLGGIAEHTADVITLCEAGTIYGSEDLRISELSFILTVLGLELEWASSFFDEC